MNEFSESELLCIEDELSIVLQTIPSIGVAMAIDTAKLDEDITLLKDFYPKKGKQMWYGKLEEVIHKHFVGKNLDHTSLQLQIRLNSFLLQLTDEDYVEIVNPEGIIARFPYFGQLPEAIMANLYREINAAIVNKEISNVDGLHSVINPNLFRYFLDKDENKEVLSVEKLNDCVQVKLLNDISECAEFKKFVLMKVRTALKNK